MTFTKENSEYYSNILLKRLENHFEDILNYKKYVTDSTLSFSDWKNKKEVKIKNQRSTLNT